MLLLLLFALIAGAGTAITPCVLPVVPALLSASAVGGRRRPLGIVLGLGLTFTLAIVALTQVISGVGLRGSAARDVAIVVLITFGVVLFIPQLAQRVQAPLSRLARFGPRTRGGGFLSGLLVGAALGFVCAPCAGPILGAIISVSNSEGGATLASTLTAVAYSLGLCLMMALYGFGGRWLLTRIRRATRGHVVERSLGAVLLATGVALIFNLDTRLTTLIANHANTLPAILVDPTRSLENSSAVQSGLADLRPASPYVRAQHSVTTASVGAQRPRWVAIAGIRTPALKRLGPAPDFRDTQQWFNTPGDRPLSLTQLRGKVVLVDFWTYTCINCVRTLPFIEGLYRTYHRAGLEIVGVETPEFSFEQEAANVRQAIATDKLTYPVVQDNHYGTWNAYHNEYWPADYLIDAHGEIRHYQFGEGSYGAEEAAVRALLYDAGDRRLPPPTSARAVIPSTGVGTPETYLNPVRYGATGDSWIAPLRSGSHRYAAHAPAQLALDSWALSGDWTATQPPGQSSEGSITPTGAGAAISGGIQAKDVYLVLSSARGVARRGRVLLDNRPIPRAEAGSAVGPDGSFRIRRETLYQLVKLPRDARFTLTVQLPPGVRAYDFTFG